MGKPQREGGDDAMPLEGKEGFFSEGEKINLQ